MYEDELAQGMKKSEYVGENTCWQKGKQERKERKERSGVSSEESKGGRGLYEDELAQGKKKTEYVRIKDVLAKRKAKDEGICLKKRGGWELKRKERWNLFEEKTL